VLRRRIERAVEHYAAERETEGISSQEVPPDGPRGELVP